jgi:hypothetical protein
MNFTQAYNLRVKTFPDGHRQFMWSDIVRSKGYELEEQPEHTGAEVERKKRENLSRAINKVYDLARSNTFDYFITLEFSPEFVNDRKDYAECTEVMKRFTKRLCKWGCDWVIVPERHPTTGAWHFHGLVKGDLALTRAHNPHNGAPLFDKDGRPIYNLNDYEFGFTTAVPLDGAPRVATYITKYYTKDMDLPKGAKHYWASRSLNKPTEELAVISAEQFGEIFNEARFQKSIETPYGNYLFCEE